MKKYQKPAVFVEELNAVSVLHTACTQKASEQWPLPAGGAGFVFTETTTYGTCTVTIEEYNAENPDTPICYHLPDDSYGLFES